MLKKAKEITDMIYPVIKQRCSKLVTGKTFWTSIALPSILYVVNVINVTKQERDQLQKVENSVYRMIPGAPSYTQEAALKGEIGAATMKARILQGQWKYMNYSTKEEGNYLLRRIV